MKGLIDMSANLAVKDFAKLIGECDNFVRINLQNGYLLVDGQVVGYAQKRDKTQFSYVIDPIRAMKYVCQLREANAEIQRLLAESEVMEDVGA